MYVILNIPVVCSGTITCAYIVAYGTVNIGMCDLVISSVWFSFYRSFNNLQFYITTRMHHNRNKNTDDCIEMYGIAQTSIPLWLIKNMHAWISLAFVETIYCNVY